MIERLRRPFGRDFLLDTATSYLEITVPFAPIFSRNNATKQSISSAAGSAENFRSFSLNFRIPVEVYPTAEDLPGLEWNRARSDFFGGKIFKDV
jgi:hypothetical protein